MKRGKATFATAGILPATCKGCRNREGGEVLDLSFLEGKKVVRIGLLDARGLKPELPEDGLVVEYEDGPVVRRVVLGFSDLGLWIEWRGETGKENPEDMLRDKVMLAWARTSGLEKVSIGGDGEKMEYSFACGGGTVLSLSAEELKLMGEDVYRHFARFPPDVGGLMEAIRLWLVRR